MTRERSEQQRSYVILSGVAVFLLSSAFFITTRLQLTVDLGYFLPTPRTIDQQLLVERLGQGPGSRLMFVSLPAEAETNGVGDAIRADLLATGLFSVVSDGSLPMTTEAIPPAVWRNRYALRDIDLEASALNMTLRKRLGDLSIVAEPGYVQLVAADPSLASIELLKSLTGPAGLPGPSEQSVAVEQYPLIAETVAPAFDAAAQKLAVDAVNSIVFAATGRYPALYGAGVYTAELQDAVRVDASLRSAVAACLIAAILFLAYRRFLIVPLSLLPVVIGGTVGVLTLALVFGQIHGITLAFGFTLLGVAIDYPLHLLSHSRTAKVTDALQSIWPTLRLGALTTVLAYMALAFGGSQGLAQLGLFSAAGLLAALLAVKWLLPPLVSVSGFTRVVDAAPQLVAVSRSSRGLSHLPWITLLCAATTLLLLLRPTLWESDMSALVPVAEDKLQRDAELRVATGAPEMRYLLAVTGDAYEDVLERTEQLQPLITQATEQGMLEGAALATALLPSEKTQRRRFNYLASVDDLEQRLQVAVQGTPFKVSAFDPFIADATAASQLLEPVTQSTWEGTVFAELATFSVLERDNRWISQSMLFGLHDTAGLRQLLSGESGVTLVDLRMASESLVAEYRQRILKVLAISSLAAVVLLWWRIGWGRRVFWIIGSLAAALAATITLHVLVRGSLSLFSLMACVLVAGLALDYGLFRSRNRQTAKGLGATTHAILACALSTFAAFAVLALSPIPVLQDIGFVVAAGVAVSYLLMLAGSRNLKRRPST